MPPIVAVINGPNLGRLGLREPETYGHTTAAELVELCRGWGRDLGCDVRCEQSDDEGGLVRLIHLGGDSASAVILNAGAYTHTSVAVRDAVLAIQVPVIELHISNPAGREALRRRNLLTDVVTAGVQGFGVAGYRLAIAGALALLENSP